MFKNRNAKEPETVFIVTLATAKGYRKLYHTSDKPLRCKNHGVCFIGKSEEDAKEYIKECIMSIIGVNELQEEEYNITENECEYRGLSFFKEKILDFVDYYGKFTQYNYHIERKRLSPCGKDEIIEHLFIPDA